MKSNGIILALTIALSLPLHADITTSSQEASSVEYSKQAQEYKQNGNKEKAIECYQHALILNPKNASAHYELGIIFAEHEQFEDAINHLHIAKQLEPKNVNAHFQLGIILCKIGRMHEAIAEYQHVLKHHPHVLSALYNIGFTLKHAGQPHKAIDIYKMVIAKDANYEAAWLALAFAYLSTGNYRKGWKTHEHNLKQMERNADALRELLHSNSIAGKKIFLRPEGGLGDSIHFVRYVQHLKELGAITIVMIQKPLVPLIANCPYIDQLLTSGDAKPTYDAEATLMTLPAVFGGTEDTIPQNIPYIFPNANLVEQWKQYLAHDSNLKIGICWQADVHNDISRLPIARRGIPLTQFYQLADIPGISFYSLQKKEGLDQVQKLPPSFSLHIFNNDFDEKHGSFMDTIAVMQHLDLIITIDTAIAHLAGAMGRNVWLLLPYSIDWRWIVGRHGSPWYPTMRIFQQPKPFDWDSVMNQVSCALQEYKRKSS